MVEKGTKPRDAASGKFVKKELTPDEVKEFVKDRIGLIEKATKKLTPDQLKEAVVPMLEFLVKSGVAIQKETEEAKAAGATTKDIMAELPSHLRKAIAGEQAKVDKEVGKIGSDFAKAVKDFVEKEEKLLNRHPELAGELSDQLTKALETVEKIKAEEAKGRKERLPKVGLHLTPEMTRNVEVLRLALDPFSRERARLLAEKSEIGGELSEVYNQITRVIREDKELSKLYKKWGNLLMKGKNKEAEEFYEKAEKDTRMVGLKKHEKELNKKLSAINQKLAEFYSKGVDVMEQIKAILAGARVDVTPPEGPGAPGGGVPKPEAEIPSVITEPPAVPEPEILPVIQEPSQGPSQEIPPVIVEPEETEEEREKGWEGESLRPAEHEEEGGEEDGALTPTAVETKEKIGARLRAWGKRISEMLRRKPAADVATVYSDAAKDGRVEETADGGADIRLGDEEVKDLSAPTKEESPQEKRNKISVISEAIKRRASMAWESFKIKSKELLPKKAEEQKLREQFASLSESLKDYKKREEAFDKLSRLKESLTELWQKEIFMQEARQRLIDSDVEVRYAMRNLIRHEKDKISTPLLVSIIDHPDLAGHEQADIVSTLYDIDRAAFLDNFKKIYKLVDEDRTDMVFSAVEQIANQDAGVMAAARDAGIGIEIEETGSEEEGIKKAA